MSLYAFLNAAPLAEEQEIVVSERFRNEDGTVRPFRIRALSHDENDRLSRDNSRNGGLDPRGYTAALVCAATVDPDFHASELCRHFGTEIPQEVPGRMLRAGEMKTLLEAIMRLSGFDSPGVLHAEAKN